MKPLDRRHRSLPRSVSALVVIAVTALGIRSDAGTALAQSPQTAPAERRFEVASVKPALSPYELGLQAGKARASGEAVPAPMFGAQTLPGGRFTASMMTLKALIARAFDVKEYQIDGGPPWLTTDYFTITANAGADATADDINNMLKTLLAERFALRTHAGTREAPVHVLTLARSDGRLGSGLKRTSLECLQQIEERRKGAAAPARPPGPRTAADLPTTPTCGTTMMIGRSNGASTLLAGGVELKTLVTQLSNELSAPVIDRTELSGLFDITVEYTSERQMNGRTPGLDPSGTDAPPPTIAGAMQQLGLKLDKQVGPMPVVVVDAAEHPSPD
jgi:uncharacterized protein (TIGR03435 family)